MRAGRWALVLLLVGFVAWCWQGSVTPEGPDGLSPAARADAEYGPEGYAFDGVIYLRTFRLMERGAGYYEAYARATREDARNDAPYARLVFWRQPWLHGVWSALLTDRGSAVMALFVAAAAVCLVAAYFALEGVCGAPGALAATVVLAAYYHYGATSRWFPFHEWWAGFWLVGAVLAAARGRMALAAGGALLAMLTREHCVLFGAAGLATCVALRCWRAAAAWAAALALFAAAYGWHALQVSRAVALEPAGLGLGESRDVMNGPLFLARALAYGWVYPAGPLPEIGAAVPLMGIIGLALFRPRPVGLLLWLAVGALLTTFLVAGFSYNSYSYYWGALAGPLVLLGYGPLTQRVMGWGSGWIGGRGSG